MAGKLLALRRADVCQRCTARLPVGTKAWWDASSRSVTCQACGSSVETHIDVGVPGASAGREYERRRSRREARTRAKHPHIGGLLLTLRSDPRHEVAFRQGQTGEQDVAASLERRTADGPAILLHDRRVPGRRGNIDHLAMAPSGVYVIDAKAWTGKVDVRRPLFGEERLFIAGRDRTSLIDGLDHQVAAVREALDGFDGPIRGVLCFTRAELPVLGTLAMRSHLLLYRKALAKRLSAAGPVSAAAVDEVARRLAERLPPA